MEEINCIRKVEMSIETLILQRCFCRFAEGNCNFGDRCNYAHGEAELRTFPIEGQKILDNKFKAERMGAQSDSPIDGPQKGHSSPGILP